MKKILIIINPYSGEKIGEKISIDILEIFKNKNINYKLIKTTHQNHPYEITNSIDLDLFDGICVVGGDGTMNEVINGMLFRKDHKKIPIGLIPFWITTKKIGHHLLMTYLTLSFNGDW